jgi:SAM-dependent methyltransferase
VTVSVCPLCGGTSVAEVFLLRNVPVICNQLWPDVEAAKSAPLGNVDLVACRACALIWNRAFEPERMVYAPGYENALHFSPKFEAFAEDLAAGLVARHNLVGKDVVEIGCGDGHMLDMLVKHGARTAVGFDPSMAGKDTPYRKRPGVEIIPEYFRSDQLDRNFDFILCRHVLEHIETPRPFVSDIRRAVGERDIGVYFEVPNSAWMLRAVSMWDAIYEHVTYWTAPAMTALFRRAGFRPTRVTEAYSGQFLALEAKPGAPEGDYVASGTEDVLAAAAAFKDAADRELTTWRQRLGALHGKAVIWGAGSKGITFANALEEAGRPLAGMVDLNPRKRGLMAPGVALPVLAPEDLRKIRPNLVLISNALYAAEIASQVKGIGLSVDFAMIAG